MGAVGKVTVEVLGPKRTVCSTLTEASGSAVVHRLDGRAGRAVETEQMLVSLTAGCDTKWVGIHRDSSLRLP
jgi:hypothetical protein